MTKTYIKPETMVYQVKIDSQLLAGSPGGKSDDPATEPAGARGFDLFDDEFTSDEE